jgi:hypothetical protein
MLFRRRRCSWTGCERPAERGHRGLCLEHHDEIIEAHGKIAAGELDAEEYAATLPSDEGEALLAVHGAQAAIRGCDGARHEGSDDARTVAALVR